MKADTERRRYHKEKLHRRKKRLRIHLSKELRSKLKVSRRAMLVRVGDTVRIMRGPRKGREAMVSNVSTVKRKVYLEGLTVRNARGKEMTVSLEPSNLMLISIESTPERKKIFTEDAFKKKPKPEKKPPAKEAKPEVKPEAKPPEKKEEAKEKTVEKKEEEKKPVENTEPKAPEPKPETKKPETTKPQALSL
jgi:ribosomal protein uL24